MKNTSPLKSTDSGAASYTGGGMRSHSILIVLFAIYMFDYADRYVVASMIDFIKRDWNITDAQAGWLMGIVLLFITVFVIPASILIDRWSRRKMVALMTLFWSLTTLACAFTKNYAQLIMVRAFLGIGEAGYAPGGTAMLAAAYPEDQRARFMGIWNASIPVGVGMGLAAGGLIAKTWGWHHAFGLVAVPGMFLAIAAWFLPDYKSVRPRESAMGFEQGEGFMVKAVGILRIPSLVFTYLGFAMNVAVTTSLMTWLPAYLERTGIVDSGKGGTFAMPIFGLVLVGAPLGGFIADRWYRKLKRSRLIFPAMTSGAAAITLIVAFLNPGQMYQISILAVYGIFVTCFIAPAVYTTQEVVNPGLRAFSYGMCVIVQHLCGDIWSPPLVGWLSDIMGLEKAVLVIPVFGILAALLFLIASRFYVRDLERVEKVQLEPE
jgi:MFS family permease